MRKKVPSETYGLPFPEGTAQAEIELLCFRDKLTRHSRFYHLRRAIQLYWPSLEWNPWLEDQLESLCNEEHAYRIGGMTARFVSWTGCGAAGKTHSGGLYGYFWWLADPDDSSVTLTSTSKTAIGQRVWPVFQKLHTEVLDPYTGKPLKYGHLIDSQKIIQAVKGDSKHAIHAMAVESGELQKTLSTIKGRHTKRMMLQVDEANTVPTAIMECLHNMGKGCSELVVLVIGNAISKFDNHGRSCTPKDGWGSVTVEDARWITKGVPEWDMEEGICCHYDGEKSPNVIAEKTLYPYLYSWENFCRRKHDSKSINYWSQDRGFWPAEGILNTIFSEVMIEKYDGLGFHYFISESTPYAFLDPAFGGDKCVAQFAIVGDINGGKQGMQLSESVQIEGSVISSDELDYQIARTFIEECKARGVAPENAGIDATGPGRGVYAIVATEWSEKVHRIEFGGAASDMPSSEEDPRPAHEVYDRKVTELWYSLRTLLCAGQLKGLYQDLIVQLCTREYSMRGRYIRLDKKDECKKKLGRSPDEADATAGLLHVARTNGLVIANLPGGHRKSQPSNSNDDQLALVAGPDRQDSGWTEHDIR